VRQKRILFIVPYVPNLIRVRPYNLVRGLSQLGHSVTLAALWGDGDEHSTLEQVEPFVQGSMVMRLPRWRSMLNVLQALPTGSPLQSRYAWQPGLAQDLKALFPGGGSAAPFDAVHVEHLRGAEYGLFLKSWFTAQRLPVPVIWDSVDSISLLFQQAKVRSTSLFQRSLTRFELGRTRRYEGGVLDRFDHVTVTSAADRRMLQELHPAGESSTPVSILPNGVDLDYFRPDPRVERQPDSLVISGKMSYHANVAMVKYLVGEIMPLVWTHCPETRVMIVGKDPTREVQELSSHPQVTVTGTVAHLPPYLQRAAIAVAPIAYGAGIQNKVLEAMACGAPVVASSQAVSAIQAEPGREVLVADDAHGFAQALVGLLEDPGRRAALGQAGRSYVEKHHHWDVVARQLDSIYDLAAQRVRQAYA
jgi:polysaccharide biosynthesis protein PslH